MTELTEDLAIHCPECGELTRDLKCYRYMHFVLCLLVYYAYEMQVVVGCPSCVRRRLAERTLINLVPGNLLWLALVLPFHLVQLLRSYNKGHSPEVLLELQQR